MIERRPFCLKLGLCDIAEQMKSKICWPWLLENNPQIVFHRRSVIVQRQRYIEKNIYIHGAEVRFTISSLKSAMVEPQRRIAGESNTAGVIV